MLKIHITHNDGDALGCALCDFIYTKLQNENTKEKVTYILRPMAANSVVEGIESIEKEAAGFIEKDHNIQIIVSDLGLSQRAFDSLIAFIKKIGLNKVATLKIFDHHKTSVLSLPENLQNLQEKLSPLGDLANKTFIHYPRIDDLGMKHQSAAWVMFRHYSKFMEQRMDYATYSKLSDLLYDISMYDTWGWKTAKNFTPRFAPHAPHYANADFSTLLCKEIGIKDAMWAVYKALSNREIFERLLVIYDNIKGRERRNVVRNIHLTKKMDMLTKELLSIPTSAFGAVAVMQNNDFNAAAAVVLDELLPRDSKKIVITLIPSTMSISIRTRGIDAGELARKFGGGGHKEAAGCRLRTDLFLELMRLYYINNEDNNQFKEYSNDIGDSPFMVIGWEEKNIPFRLI